MLNIDTSDMISIGSFDYTINEAATLYLVDVNKGKAFYYLSPLSTACMHGLIVRYFKGWGGESFETFDEFVYHVTKQIEAMVHFATKIDVSQTPRDTAINPPRKNEMNQSREYTPKEDVDYLAVQKALTEMKEQRPASASWNPKASLKKQPITKLESEPPWSKEADDRATEKGQKEHLMQEVECNELQKNAWNPKASLKTAKVPKMMTRKTLRPNKCTGNELRKKARELLTEKPKQEHCV